MTNVLAPLLDLFYELRQRNFPLGTSDYVTALNALIKGGVTNREDLLFVCQLVWAKSPEEQRQVAEALAASLPQELKEQDLKALSEEPIQPERSAPSTAEFNAESLPGAPPVAPELPPSQLEKGLGGSGPTTVGCDLRFLSPEDRLGRERFRASDQDPLASKSTLGFRWQSSYLKASNEARLAL